MPVRVHWLMPLSLAVACGGPRFDGTTYRGEGFTFHVPHAPNAWQQLDVEGGGLVFRDPGNDATIAVSGRCGDHDDDVPLVALTQHLFLQFTDRDVLRQEVVPFDRREAMHTVLVAKLDGVPKKFDVWILKKDGCVYDLYYIADPTHFDVGVRLFQSFVTGFSARGRNGN